MFNVTTGVILKIDAYYPNRKITLLTDNNGIKVVSLSNLQQYLHNYYLLDVWTFIVNINSKDEVWIPYEQLSRFKQLQNNCDVLKLIYYFNKIVINSQAKYHNNNTLQFLLNCYQELISNRNKLEKMYCFLLFHTLSLQGIQFNFKNCINCGINNNIIDFKPQLGGIVCSNCVDITLVKTNNLLLFNQLIFLDSIDNWNFTKQELKYIINILESHCQAYSGINIFNYSKKEKK